VKGRVKEMSETEGRKRELRRIGRKVAERRRG